MFIPDSWDAFTVEYMSYLALGFVLVLINLYSSVSAYSTLGDFAYFYGDFFIPAEQYRPQTRYSGKFFGYPLCFRPLKFIFRYLSLPQQS